MSEPTGPRALKPLEQAPVKDANMAAFFNGYSSTEAPITPAHERLLHQAATDALQTGRIEDGMVAFDELRTHGLIPENKNQSADVLRTWFEQTLNKALAKDLLERALGKKSPDSAVSQIGRKPRGAGAQAVDGTTNGENADLDAKYEAIKGAWGKMWKELDLLIKESLKLDLDSDMLSQLSALDVKKQSHTYALLSQTFSQGDIEKISKAATSIHLAPEYFFKPEPLPDEKSNTVSDPERLERYSSLASDLESIRAKLHASAVPSPTPEPKGSVPRVPETAPAAVPATDDLEILKARLRDAAAGPPRVRKDAPPEQIVTPAVEKAEEPGRQGTRKGRGKKPEGDSRPPIDRKRATTVEGTTIAGASAPEDSEKVGLAIPRKGVLGAAAVGLAERAAPFVRKARGKLEARKARREQEFFDAAEADPENAEIFRQLAELKKRNGAPRWSDEDMRTLKIAVGKIGKFNPKWWQSRIKEFLPSMHEGDMLARARYDMARIRIAEEKAEKKVTAREDCIKAGHAKLTDEEKDALQQAIVDGKLTADIVRDFAAMIGGWFGGGIISKTKGVAWSEANQKLLDTVRPILMPVWRVQAQEHYERRVQETQARHAADPARLAAAVSANEQRVRRSAPGIGRLPRKVLDREADPVRDLDLNALVWQAQPDFKYKVGTNEFPFALDKTTLAAGSAGTATALYRVVRSDIRRVYGSTQDAVYISEHTTPQGVSFNVHRKPRHKRDRPIGKVFSEQRTLKDAQQIAGVELVR